MKKAVIGSGVVVALLLGVWLLASPSGNKQPSDKPETVSTLHDAHGLAVDRKDPTKVYIATHTGLLMMINDGELQRVGNSQDDYMGFSAHPTDPSTFYVSGHPTTGGNLGFQKSMDGGKTWQKIANGVNGPVDFHTMTLGQADPSFIYGVYRGQLQLSRDEGKNWELISTDLGNIITLATNTKTKDMVYAGTTNGLYASQDQGNNWAKLTTLNSAVMALVVNPANDQEIVAYEQDQGLMRSTNTGTSWDKLNGYVGSIVMHLAYDTRDPKTMYLINQNLEIHKTTDGGQTWTKVR